MNAQHDRLRKAAEALGQEVGDVLSSHPTAGTYPDGPCLEKHSRIDLQSALAELDAALAAPKEAGPSGDVPTRFIDGMGWVVACKDAVRFVRDLAANPPGDQRQEGEYDRELVADMLEGLVYDDGYGMKSHGPYTVEAIAEQARLLREADNRDGAGVHTAHAASPPPEAAAPALVGYINPSELAWHRELGGLIVVSSEPEPKRTIPVYTTPPALASPTGVDEVARLRAALEKIARVNACDYEYRAWATAALAARDGGAA